ncbi:RagB/SusD family nutrient uptake outer membrane protein [Pseudochryseolinea flava]|uniref:RagB/SusD family nutrient uptake outer membrane protein n=1 Tax=Pseudochryseolinea flava TaxID=2059302 RepID=A0A364Y1Q2_9BACT|nr:RagB/SusD family nutrient uptake outer membrane protein [Pseudochryseolinea flava]RAW00193.1 RagB/SusD family nutrient uptake outer membrane protein [Pseudochryseolinea flava]
MKKINLYILIVLMCMSCADLDIAPIDAQSELNYWETDEDANTYLNTLYADIMSADTYLFLSALTDDAYTRREEIRNIGNGNYDPSNGFIMTQWSQRYEGIRRSNIFMNNIDRVEGLTDAKRNEYKGQAMFIRAWHYFLLTQWFGDVPLVTDEITIEEALSLTRTAKATIDDFIEEQLGLAISFLPETYPAGNEGRITKGAAIALKSRFHLYNGEDQQAADLASDIFGKYSLYPSYAGLFKMENESNEEVILDLQYVPTNREHNIQYSLIPPSEGGYANFSPFQEFVDVYTMVNGLPITDAASGYDESNPYINRDPRLAANVVFDNYSWTRPDGSLTNIDTSPNASPNGINFSSNTTPTGYYVAKYYDRTARSVVNSGLNLILIRYAEVLLNYAEAKVNLETFNATDWDNTIKLIRQRAGLTGTALDFPGADQETLKQIIRDERRKELAFEAGHRFFDIRRWKIAEDVLKGWLHGIKTDVVPEDDGYQRVDFKSFDESKHYLWPIPQSERDLNKSLSQNDNW